MSVRRRTKCTHLCISEVAPERGAYEDWVDKRRGLPAMWQMGGSLSGIEFAFMRARHRLFTAGVAVITAARADRWLRNLARGLGIVLMFHHVRPRRNVAFAPNH